jgi:hypothetical protein
MTFVMCGHRWRDGKPPSRRDVGAVRAARKPRIVAMDAGASLFLSHRNPAVVSQLGNLRSD